MGASDFAASQYTYDDLPAGATDPRLATFSVARDDRAVVPVLREILSINSRVRVMASPWSVPAWMKSSGRLGGGSLRPQWYAAWAQYFVRFVRAYAARGITVSAVTVQNEPGHSDPSYPTMTMSAAEQARFIATRLSPAFAAARLTTNIIGYDHNWDTPTVPSELLGDAAAGRYLTGIAWHCYRGDWAAQSQVHARFPAKATWLTECSGGLAGRSRGRFRLAGGRRGERDAQLGDDGPAVESRVGCRRRSAPRWLRGLPRGPHDRRATGHGPARHRPVAGVRPARPRRPRRAGPCGSARRCRRRRSARWSSVVRTAIGRCWCTTGRAARSR